MAFGVRSNPVPGGTPPTFYACPLCDYVTTDKQDMINHLHKVHGWKPNVARAVVENL